MKRSVLVVVVAVGLVLTALVAFQVGAARNPDPSFVAGQTSPGRQTPPERHATPAPTPTRLVEDGPARSTSAFVRAWLDPKPRTRRTALAATCTPRLAGLLLLTDVAKIPTAVPAGAPVLVRRAVIGVTYQQRLSDGTAIAVDLVPDPTRPLGWVVTSVRPRES